MGGAGATMPTYRDGLCELSECYAFPVGPRTDGLLACKAHGGVAPVSAARTLPVTPAERAAWIRLVKAERAWHEQTEALDGVRDYDMKSAYCEVDAAGQALRDLGIDPDTGAALLARVEAAPDYEQGRRDAITSAADHLSACHDPAIAPRNAARMIVDHEAGRLSGTTPIDAPPAKEPR